MARSLHQDEMRPLLLKKKKRNTRPQKAVAFVHRKLWHPVQHRVNLVVHSKLWPVAPTAVASTVRGSTARMF